MADTFKLIAIICMIIALIALIIAVILFFTLNIRKVIGDLSGSTAKKYVKDMQKKSKNTVEALNYANIANINGQIINQKNSYKNTNNTDINYGTNNYINRTEAIANSKNEGLGNSGESITAKLPNLHNKEAYEATVLLEDNATTVLDNATLKTNGFEVYLDIVVKHTNEKI